ncbi:hypothetical protein EDD15DRAFT_787369, partial [Pisolithus albus]
IYNTISTKLSTPSCCVLSCVIFSSSPFPPSPSPFHRSVPSFSPLPSLCRSCSLSSFTMASCSMYVGIIGLTNGTTSQLERRNFWKYDGYVPVPDGDLSVSFFTFGGSVPPVCDGIYYVTAKTAITSSVGVDSQQSHTLNLFSSAYATTFNGCQGLTLTRTALDLRTDCFAHGQLYTALSRVRRSTDSLIMFATSNTTRDTANIVYRNLLLHHTPHTSLP